ncbi:MAG: hypothetical protein ABEI52_02345 [Halobacteriaceae archaeon]
MATNALSGQKPSDDITSLGIDTAGYHHEYIESLDKIVITDPNDRFSEIRELGDRALGEYMKFAALKLGWNRIDLLTPALWFGDSV